MERSSLNIQINECKGTKPAFEEDWLPSRVSRRSRRIAVLRGRSWRWASGSHQPCLLAWWWPGSPSQAGMKQFFWTVAACMVMKFSLSWIEKKKKEKKWEEYRVSDQTLMLNPALALVSINITPTSRDLASPSSIETCLFQILKHFGQGKLILYREMISRRTYVNEWPFVNKISFVPHENYDHVAAALCANFFDPFWRVQKWLSICKSINKALRIILELKLNVESKARKIFDRKAY